MESSSYHGLQYKYIQFQIKIGNILNDGKYGFSIDSHGLSVVTNMVDNNTLSTASSISSSSKTCGSLTTSLKIGLVKDVKGIKLGYPNALDLIELFAYVKLNYLSNESGDNLLKLIHDFCERHPSIDDVFLHTKYRSIHECVNKAISDLYEIYDIGISIPTPLLGTTVQEKERIQNILLNRGGGSLQSSSMTNNNSVDNVIYAKGIGLNIVELASQYLTEISRKDFDPYPVQHYHGEERCYSRFATADLFSHICFEVKERYGDNVIPVCLQLSFDATDISGGGGSAAKSATPFHIRVLNVSDDVFPLQDSTILSGFLPQLTVNIILINLSHFINLPICFINIL
jgi:hypothetical protein